MKDSTKEWIENKMSSQHNLMIDNEEMWAQQTLDCITQHTNHIMLHLYRSKKNIRSRKRNVNY